MNDPLLFKLTESQRDSIKNKLAELKTLQQLTATQRETISSRDKLIAWQEFDLRCCKGWLLATVLIAILCFVLMIVAMEDAYTQRSYVRWIEELDNDGLENVSLAEYFRELPEERRRHVRKAAARKILKWQFKQAEEMIDEEWKMKGYEPSGRDMPVKVYAGFYQSLMFPDAVFKDYARMIDEGTTK